MAESPRFGIVVHGGSGVIARAALTPEDIRDHRAALERALRAGDAILAGGGSAVDAVLAAVVSLEDCPAFNCGKGSVFAHDGTIQMDASVMDGADLNAGAVAGISLIKNPILAAHKVMTDSSHVMLVGAGAEAFARHHGLATEPPTYFETDKRRAQLERAKRANEVVLDHGNAAAAAVLPPAAPAATAAAAAAAAAADDSHFGTVGAVALDRHGNLASATSTGGMTNKRWGRVGDTPIIGAGTYSSNATCAVSSTGHGEYFLRAAVAYQVSARMEFGGQGLQEAADAVVHGQLRAMGGGGGLIGIDRHGNTSMTYNTAGMYRGRMVDGGKPETAIWEADDSDGGGGDAR